MIDKNTTISSDQARQLINACFADIRREEDERGPFIPTTPYPCSERLEQEALASEAINQLELQLECHEFSPDVHEAAERLLEGRGVVLGGMEPSGQAKLLHGAVRALVEQHRLFIRRLHDPLAVYQPVDPIFVVNSQFQPMQFQHMAAEGESTSGITTGHAIDDYLAAMKGRWIKKTAKARVFQLSYFLEFAGADRPLSSVTADAIRTFRNALTKLRANHGKKKHLTFQERLTENGEFQIQNKTASLYFEPIKSFFRWAKEEEGLLKANPAADIRWQLIKEPKAVKSRRPFTEDELHILFSSTVFTGCKSEYRRFEPGPNVIKDDRYWIVTIGYYTGARLGEIVQLHVDDVVLDHDVPHFDLNESAGTGDPKHIKTVAGVRKIPIHPDLLKLGFGEFVAKRRKWDKPGKRLFSEITLGTDGQASTQFSKMFARMLDKVGLTDTALTFHSLRHGAEDAFRNASLPQYTIDSIMGHSDGKVSSLYGEGPSLELKAEAVNEMRLPLRLIKLWLYQEQ